jgi:hypothetical protein
MQRIKVKLESRKVLFRPSLIEDIIDVFQGWCEADGSRHMTTRRCLDHDWLNSKITFDGRVLDFGEDPRPFVFEGRPAIVACVYGPYFGYRNHLYKIERDSFSRSILLIPEYLSVGKNWSPFTYADGTLGFIHSFDPLVLLKETRRERGVIVLDCIQGFSDISEMGPGGFPAYRGGTNGAGIDKYVTGVGHTTRSLPEVDNVRRDYKTHRSLLRRPFGWILDPESARIQLFDFMDEFPADFISVNPTSLIRLSDFEFELITTEASGPFSDQTSRCEIASHRFSIGRNIIELMESASGKAEFIAKVFRSEMGRLADEVWRCDLAGINRHVIYGPYRRLPAGSYEIAFKLEARNLEGGEEARLRLEVVANANNFLADRFLQIGTSLCGQNLILHFEHRNDQDMLEFRLYASGYTKGHLEFGGAVVQPAF